MKEYEFVTIVGGKKHFLCWVDGTVYNCVEPSKFVDVSLFDFIEYINSLIEVGFKVYYNTYTL